MSVFLIATLEVRGASFARFSEAMGQLQSIVEGVGWKLASAYVHRTGPLNTVIDVWELDDLNHMNAGFGAIGADPRGAQIQATMQDAVIRETLNFADAIVYPKPA